MDFPPKAKSAMEKILQAEAEFQNSLGDQACDSEKQIQLAAALKVAVDEFIDAGAALWPKIQASDTSDHSTAETAPAE